MSLQNETPKKSYGVNGPCNAPWNNMYFTVAGYVSPCWKLPGFVDNWSPDRSIMDIWKGEHFQKYRDALAKSQFLDRCKECGDDIACGVWPLAKAYEKFSVKEYPSLMELELSNQCNLECTMCNGTLSSGIRKNREKLPPLPMMYTDAFKEQLAEFIPHLEELRFNGGEPFTQKIVLDICDMVAEINPGLRINMATNGTVYNKRVQHIMDNCNLHVNISIDSFIPERYESIRINGKFDQLMKNFEIFNKYCKDNNRHIAIMVNPMINNWDEMIDAAKWCDEKDVNLWFNTILYPEHLAIWNKPLDTLKEIYYEMRKHLAAYPHGKNRHIAEHLVEHTIKEWVFDAAEKSDKYDLIPR